MTEERWQRVDVAVAVVAFVLLTVPALHHGPVGALAFGAATTLPIAVRRRWPLPVLAVIVATTAIGTAAGVEFTPFVSNTGVGVGLAMYTVAERLGRRTSLAALAVTIPVVWAATGIAYATTDRDQDGVHVIAALAGWVAGDLVRAQRRHRDDLAARRRAEERLRLSREVHDVVSHSLAVIAVQAGVGRMVFDTQPDQARTALAEIEQLSRTALDELRRILSSARDDEPSRTTLPSIDDLPALVDALRGNGVAVTLTVEGEPADLPAGLGRSAYRIVQEALTNAVKHAPGAAVDVTVRYEPGEVRLSVLDDGARSTPSLPPGGGWGIPGMQERAALFGGTVEAGPREDRGFAVEARLPVGQAVPA